MRNKLIGLGLAGLLVVVAVVASAAVDSRARDMIDSIRKGRNDSGRVIDLYVADDVEIMDDFVCRGKASFTQITYLVSNPAISIPEQFSSNKGAFIVQTFNLATNVFDNDYISVLQGVWNDDASNTITWGEVRMVSDDASSTSPDGSIELHIMVDSSAVVRATLDAVGLTLVDDLAVNGDDITADGDLTITAGGADIFLGTNVLTKGALGVSGALAVTGAATMASTLDVATSVAVGGRDLLAVVGQSASTGYRLDAYTGSVGRVTSGVWSQTYDTAFVTAPFLAIANYIGAHSETGYVYASTIATNYAIFTGNETNDIGMIIVGADD